MDYEHIVFQCRVFFSHGHLSASYPKAKGLKQSNWRNKVKIYPENLQSLSNRIRRDQWLPAPIQCYVSPPAYSKDSTDSEMRYPWLGKAIYEIDPIDMIALRCFTWVLGSLLRPVPATRIDLTLLITIMV